MSKEAFARLITTFIQSQVGVRELGTRPMICVPGVFFSVRSGVNYPQYPVAQTVSYDHVQKQQIMIPIDEQTAQVHGQFEPNPAPAEA